MTILSTEIKVILNPWNPTMDPELRFTHYLSIPTKAIHDFSAGHILPSFSFAPAYIQSEAILRLEQHTVNSVGCTRPHVYTTSQMPQEKNHH